MEWDICAASLPSKFQSDFEPMPPKTVDCSPFRTWFGMWPLAACLAVGLVPSWCSEALAERSSIIHVSPARGNDSNPGTAAAPLANISAAVAIVRPGDTILLAPGLYKLQSKKNYGVAIRTNGTPEAPIILRGDGGEAILDCSDLTKTSTVYCLNIEADWWRISNIAVTGAKQNRAGSWVVGINLVNASNNILRNVRSYRHQGPGIVVSGASGNNLLEDCEAFGNFDPLSDVPGGNADGIQITSVKRKQDGNVVSRCRVYDNSDDGFDLWKTEAVVTIRNSVASRNGYVPGTSEPAGDGVGFKLGVNRSGPPHQILNNLAVDNRAAGFDLNGAAGKPVFIGNIARSNGKAGYN